MPSSLSLIVSLQKIEIVNKLFVALQRGPDNFSLMFSPTGAAPQTHTGCHFGSDDELGGILASRTVPATVKPYGPNGPEYTVDIAAAGLTQAEADEAINAISVLSVPDSNGIANMLALAESLGLIRYTPPEEEF